jgi:hypothetical protein
MTDEDESWFVAKERTSGIAEHVNARKQILVILAF